MTRISTAQAFDASLQQLQRRQLEMSEAQEQLTSGKRVARASDDPTAAARAERALAGVSRIQADQRAVEASRAATEQTEAALGDAGDLLQRARELLVSAGNAALGDSERRGIATELRGIRQQLLAVANRDDGAGTYLFGGQGASRPPFVDAPGGVTFNGTPGSSQVAGGEQLPNAVDGEATWLAARSGNGTFRTAADAANVGDAWIDVGSVVDPSAITGSAYEIRFVAVAGAMEYSVLRDGVAMTASSQPYTAGQAIAVDGMAVTVSGAPADGDRFEMLPSTSDLSVFDTLDQAVRDLETPNRRTAQRTQASIVALRDIDQSMTRLSNARADAGAMLNRIDGVTDRLDGLALAHETDRSNAEDLDMVHAISDFQARQSGYDAALKSYAMVQRLSLFQYLNT